MNKELEDLLQKGLMDGYVGGNERQTVHEGPFTFELLVSPNGNYRDKWMADNSGGGQEVAMVGDKKATRLHAGGVVEADVLSELGITKKEIIGKLKGFIKESNGQTRLFAPFTSVDGDYTYDYHLIDSVADVVRVGMETIQYKGEIVFAHGFLHANIE